jgi:hypothetical protein
MPQTDDSALQEQTKGSPYRPHGLRFTAVTLPILSLLIVGVDPVLAQQPLQSSVCSAENLPGMIEGFFQITTSLGIIGLAIVWQADSLIDMFTLDPDQKKEFKQHKLSAMKSAVILVVLGPLYTVAGSIMGLPLAECVNLAPW